MRKLKLFLLLVFLLSSGSLISQDKSIIDLFRSNSTKANSYFEHNEFNRAKRYYLKLYKRDSLNSLYKLRLAECNMLLNNTEESEIWYRKVINDGSFSEPKYKLHFAEILLSNGKNEEAKKWFEKYNNDNKEDKRSKVMAMPLSTIKKLLKDSLAYTVSPVNFNSLEADFSTVYYDKGIVFLSSRKYHSIIKNVSASDNTFFLNLFYTEFKGDSSFSKPLRFHEDLNSSLHDGPVTFFDGGKKVVFSRNQKAIEKDGPKKLGLFCGELHHKGNKWRKIHQLPFNSKEYNVSHPYFHEPTNTLYFVSDMKGGYGGSDIYKSVLKGTDWSTPKNLGPVINSEKNETFPFVSPDTILFFSSNGHRGLGGLDIFQADLKKSSFQVINLGYPVNSSKDDFAFVLNDSGNEGFFSSNRKNGGLDDDIYKVRSNRTKLELTVIDKLKSVMINNARISLINQETNEKEGFANYSQKGIYILDLVPGRNYRAEIYADGYKPEIIELSPLNPEQKTMKVKAAMEKYNKIFVNGKVTLNGDKAGVCRIFVYDPTADSVEVLNSNSKGEFLCQINTDTTNILVANGQSMMGVFLAKPEKRKRKSSSLQFIEIPLGTLDSVNVKGVFKSSSIMLPGWTSQVVIRNELTNREQYLKFNEKGEFNIKLWDACKYNIFIVNGTKKSLIKSFEPMKTRYLELVE